MLVPAALVSGHAAFDHSTPADGAVLTTAPARVDAYFDQDMFNQPGANNLNVVGPGGGDVDNNNATVDAANKKHMFITLQSGLTSGQYTVEWNSTSDEDGDTADGTLHFTLQLPEPTSAGPAATTAPGTTPVATTAASSGGTGVTITSAGSGPATSGTGYRLPIVALAVATAGAAALALGIALRSRQRRA